MQNVFEAEAERYDRWFDRHPELYAAELKAVREALPDGVSRAFEIGSGTGRFGLPLGISEGVEPAASMRDIAVRRGFDAIADVAEALPFADSRFDVALMVTTICFVADASASCREAWRVLKPGGRFIVGFVDRESTLGQRYDSRRQTSPFYRDAVFFSLAELRRLLVDAGFRELRFWQTLFPDASGQGFDLSVKPGIADGGFTVVAARKE